MDALTSLLLARCRSIPVFDAEAKAAKLEKQNAALESDKRFLQSRVNDLKDQLADERRKRNKA